jgi:hypothetical protein
LAIYHPDGHAIVTAREYSEGFDLREAWTGKTINRWGDERNWIHAISYSDDGRRVVSAASRYGTGIPYSEVKIWDVSTGNIVANLRLAGWARSVSLSSDGKKVLVVSAGKAKLFDVEWAVAVVGRNLRERACLERLVGAQEFNNTEMRDPILSGREQLRNPCQYRGIGSMRYWQQWAKSVKDWVRTAEWP